jgi:hypothetical protein
MQHVVFCLHDGEHFTGTLWIFEQVVSGMVFLSDCAEDYILFLDLFQSSSRSSFGATRLGLAYSWYPPLFSKVYDIFSALFPLEGWFEWINLKPIRLQPIVKTPPLTNLCTK